MKKYLFFLFCLISILGCDKDDQGVTRIQEGTYVGTFQRELDWGPSDTAQITLAFWSDTWEGRSNRDRYPALCNGTYSIVNDTIIFENACMWTAEFDHTLILSGKYGLTIEGITIKFNRGRDKYIINYLEQD